jgi:hypothetical protein
MSQHSSRLNSTNISGTTGPGHEATTSSPKESRLIASILNNTHRHHLCALFRDQDEEFRKLLPFIIDGLAAGEKAIHVVHPRHREEHRHRLGEAGIDVEAVEEVGQLDVVAGPSGYIEGETFDQDGALKIIDHLLSEARRKGFRQTRFIGFMDWTLEIRSEDLIAFEALLNPVLEKHDDPFICSFDLSRFNGADVIDVMRTHPAALIGGVVQQNPFYIPAEQMLEELRERGGIGRDEREH